MATKAQPIEIDALISLEEAGRLLGLSAERIRVLVKAGLIDRPQPGRVVLSSVARGYARYWQDKASQETKTSADSRVIALLPAEITGNKIVYPDEAALTPLEFGAAVTLTDPARAELMARFKSA